MKKIRDRGFALMGIMIACAITAIIIGGGVYAVQKVKVGNLEREMDTLRSQTRETLQDSTLDQKKFEAWNVSDITARIENWSLYKKDTKVLVGTGDCGNNEFNILLEEANTGSKMLQELDGITLVYTPNTKKLTNAQFLGFENSVCAAGGINPIYAYEDKLLWSGGSGGMIPDPDAPSYLRAIGQWNAEKIIENYFTHKN